MIQFWLEEWMNESSWIYIVWTRRMDNRFKLESNSFNQKNRWMRQVGIRQFQLEDCDCVKGLKIRSCDERIHVYR